MALSRRGMAVPAFDDFVKGLEVGFDTLAKPFLPACLLGLVVVLCMERVAPVWGPC